MLRSVWFGLRHLFSRSRSQNDLQDEVDDFLQAAVADKVAAGMSEAEAKRAVRIENGSPDLVRDQAVAERWEISLESVLRDLRFAARILSRNPTMAAVAVLTLALGIGATTAMFSVVRGVLLRPFPFPQQNRLILIWQKGTDGRSSNVGYATLEDWRRLNHSFSQLSAISFWSPTLVTSAESENLNGFRVSAGTFGMLGVPMALGRDFVHDEDVPGRGSVLILSHGLWRRRFSSDPAIVGKSVQLGAKVYTVVGVLPENFPAIFSFDPRRQADVYSPLAYDTSLLYACRTCQHLRVLGRLREGVTQQQAFAEMNQISDAIVRQYPTEYSASGVLFTPLLDYVVGDIRPVLKTLFFAVAFVLLIACVNVSNLLLSFAAKRHREFALRNSLGASRRRLARQVLTESVVLSAAGAAVGLLFAWAALAFLPKLGASIPRMSSVHLDLSVFAFTTLLAFLSAILFGFVPAHRTGRADPAESLNESARLTPSSHRMRLRSVLVAADVAISIILMIGAGLLAKSFDRLANVDPGFQPNGVLTCSVSLWGQKYAKSPAVVAFYEEALRQIQAIHGVQAAALTSQLPLGGDRDQYGAHIVDKPNPNPEDDPSVERFSVSPSYFRVLHIPLLQGREFTSADTATSQRVMLINQSFGEKVWPSENPIGKQVRVGDIKSEPYTIVGIVGDVLHVSLEAPRELQMYFPSAQFDDSGVTLVVRSAGVDPASLAPAVRGAIAAIDPQQPVSDMATMRNVVSDSMARRRFAALLFAAFAAIGLVLAGVGIYGAISYAVVQRVQEIGIRVALGARRRDILFMIVSQGMRPAIAGAIIGTLASLANAEVLSSLLFRVAPRDAETFLLVIPIVLVVGGIACYLPARRALRLDPLAALRTQ